MPHKQSPSLQACHGPGGSVSGASIMVDASISAGVGMGQHLFKRFQIIVENRAKCISGSIRDTDVASTVNNLHCRSLQFRHAGLGFETPIFLISDDVGQLFVASAQTLYLYGGIME